MAVAPSAAHLIVYYTGAGSNSDPTLSIGGDISSQKLTHQSVTGSLPTGITVLDAFGNGVGVGTLTYTSSTTSIQWQPYLGSIGTAVDISVSGNYFIQGASNGGGIAITVDAANLPTSNSSSSLTIANQTQKYFTNVTKALSDTGVTRYHAFAIKNTHSTDPIIGIKLFISANTPGADNITLYLDPLAAGDGSTTSPTPVANETTAPAGATWVAPDSATHADALSVGDLTAGQVRFFWMREVVPAGVSTSTDANTFALGCYLRA